MSTKPDAAEVKGMVSERQKDLTEEVWEKLPEMRQKQLALQLAKLLERVMQAAQGEVCDE